MSKRPATGAEKAVTPADSSPEAAAPPEAVPESGDECRHDKIATGAYLRAAARGFIGGDPVEDWLAAEADVDGSSRTRD